MKNMNCKLGFKARLRWEFVCLNVDESHVRALLTVRNTEVKIGFR